MNGPDWHFAEADRLLSSVGDDQLDLPFAKARIAKAHAHAVLAQCPDWYADDLDDELPPVRMHGLETRTATGDRL